VDGGEFGVDADTLDLRSWGKAQTDIVYDIGNPENGTVTFYDAFGAFLGTMRFENIENVIPCFTPGTLIDTNRGAVAVEQLQVGDRVLTRDNGFQTVRWAGAKRMDADHLRLNPALQPVLIRQGALGHGVPQADMQVSPQHRMLLTGPRAELLFGEAEVLAPALHLVGMPGVERVCCDDVTYLHVMFDQHEIICANGAWTESFQPGDRAMAGLGVDTCAELVAIFPELASATGRNQCRAARLSLKQHEVRALLAA
jgi:Hint domain